MNGCHLLHGITGFYRILCSSDKTGTLALTPVPNETNPNNYYSLISLKICHCRWSVVCVKLGCILLWGPFAQTANNNHLMLNRVLSTQPLDRAKSANFEVLSWYN